jgi:hypothetical protein
MAKNETNKTIFKGHLSDFDWKLKVSPITDGNY